MWFWISQIVIFWICYFKNLYSDILGLAQSASHSSPIVVVGEVFPFQGFGDLGYDGLGLGAGGHAGDKKISKIKQSFQTCQGSVQQQTEVIYIWFK